MSVTKVKFLGKILSSIDRLPPFPMVALKVVQMARDENVSMKEIARVVELDPSITANVLKWCNSPYFGLTRKITSVQEALVYLGGKNLIEVVLMSSCEPYLKGKVEGYELDEGELWRHSVGCAILAQLLGRKAGFKDETLLFTGGLLHDIGKIVLAAFIKDAYLKIKELIAAGKDFLEAEREIVGIDHARLGARIGQKWKFPEEIINIIAFHHRPEMINKPAVALVHLADAGTLMLGVGAGVDGLAYRASPKAYRMVGLKEKDLMACMADLWEELDKIEEMIGLKKAEN